MSSETPIRRRSRGEATRIAIIETAEMLFAEHGINGVSLRQIGVLAGSANTNVVAYHFGNRDALIMAVIAHRLPGIEAMRAVMLREREAAAEPLSLMELLYILYRPVIQQRNSEGKRSYAAFLGGLLRSGAAWQRYSLDDEYPTTRLLIQRIGAQLGVDRPLFHARMKICTNMVVSSLDLLEKEGIVSNESEGRHFLDVLSMAEGALRAPVAPLTILPVSANEPIPAR